MNISLRRPLLFILAFAFTLALYGAALNGTPIWDDYTFWFQDPVMGESVSYFRIWTEFGWPFSVSLQKLLFEFWKYQFLNYHLLNLCLHFANASLVYHLSRYLRFKYSFLIFLMFLLHPVCVISTAWMVQIKTLLCFFFGLASFIFFLKGQKKISWMIWAWILFALSLASKSASLTLPLIFLVVSYKSYKFKKGYFLIPFFLLSLLGSYRVLTSPVTFVGTSRAAEVLEKQEQVEKPVLNIESKPVVNNLTPPTEAFQGLKFFKLNLGLVAQTLYYYFWQPLLPEHLHPVKGLNLKRRGPVEYIHLFFLLCLVVIFRKKMEIYYLAAFHFLMLPFFGLIPAPFMNVTWVSDQHLYLALPAFLFFWMKMIERMNGKYAYLIPMGFLIFFSLKTYEASKMYRNEIIFFEKSLEFNPRNVPIVYNLAMSYVVNGSGLKAYNLLHQTYEHSKSNSEIKNNPYYPQMLYLLYQMEKAMQEEK